MCKNLNQFTTTEYNILSILQNTNHSMNYASY